MNDGKIHIPGRTYRTLRPGKQPIIRISTEAYNKLVEITNASRLSLSAVASQVILQGAELIVYDRGDN